jgi:hypothetical protein
MLHNGASKSLARISTSPDTGDSTPPPPSRLIMAKAKSSSHHETRSLLHHNTTLSSCHSEAADTDDNTPPPPLCLMMAKIKPLSHCETRLLLRHNTSSSCRSKASSPRRSTAPSSHPNMTLLHEVMELTNDSDDTNSDPPYSHKRKSLSEIPNPCCPSRHPPHQLSPQLMASPSPDAFTIKQEYNGSLSDPILLDDDTDDDDGGIKNWPRDFFAIDIVACFTAVRENSVKARGHREKVKVVFKNFFNVPFCASTFYDHYAQWTSAPQAAKDKALSGCHTSAGS